MDLKKLTYSEVVSCINRVVDSLDRLAPTTTKYGSPIQALVQAGLEWIESLHTNSVAEEQPSPENKPSPDQKPGKEAPNKATWECVPIGYQWRAGLGKPHARTLKRTFENALPWEIHEGGLTPSRGSCAILTLAANKQPTNPRIAADKFAPLAMNQTPNEGTLKVAAECHDDPERPSKTHASRQIRTFEGNREDLNLTIREYEPGL